MRWLSLLGAACLLAATAVACGGSSVPRGSAGTSAGSGSSGTTGTCTDDTECHAGSYCINGHCGTCDGVRPLACPVNTHCVQSGSQNGACVPDLPADGGTSGSSGSSGSTGSVTTCAHRSDCPGAEACLGLPDAGVCGAPAADAGCSRNDDCVKAFICQAHTCVFGCINNNDCHGTEEPVCIAGNPGHCGICTESSQCFSGENCENGQCVAKSACTTADTCGGLGCVGGFCGPCTAAADCSGGNQCDTATGHCVSGPAGCTSDAQCQSQNGGSQAWWCDHDLDGGVPQCRLGCAPDSTCQSNPQQLGCCNLAAGKSCDLTTHFCVDASSTGSTTGSSGTTSGSTGSSGTTGSCPSNFCDGCFANNQQCDQTDCVCVGGTGSTSGSSGSTGTTGSGSCGGTPSGGLGQPCNADCTCKNGRTCGDFFGDTLSPSDPSAVAECQAACSAGAPIAFCL